MLKEVKTAQALISRQVLDAAESMTAKKNSRRFLSCVNFSDDGAVHKIHASDGKALIQIKEKHALTNESGKLEQFSGIVCGDIVKQAVKASKTAKSSEIDVSVLDCDEDTTYPDCEATITSAKKAEKAHTIIIDSHLLIKTLQAMEKAAQDTKNPLRKDKGVPIKMVIPTDAKRALILTSEHGDSFRGAAARDDIDVLALVMQLGEKP